MIIHWRYLKSLLLFIALLMFVSGVASDKHNDIYFLSYSDDTASVTIVGIRKNQDGVIDIPGYIVKKSISYSVKRISDDVFSRRTDIRSVKISDSVIYIGNRSFSGCSQLSKVSLSSNLRQLNSGLFSGCTNLKEIHIPENVTNILGYAFQGCQSLTKIEIPSSVSYIEDLVFSDCPNLNDVYVGWDNPDDITCGYSPFGKDNYKKILHVPNGTIGQYLRCGYPWNSFGYITDGNDTIASSFEYDGFICSLESLDSLTVAVKYIGNACFVAVPSYTIDGCGKVHTVRTVADYAFVNMHQLDTIVLPNTVATISDFAFENCSNLQKVVFPDSLAVIRNYSFRGCKRLQIDSLPNKLHSIGDGAFFGCTSLSSIKIPESIAHIGNQTFMSTHEITACWEIPERELVKNLLSGADFGGILHVPEGCLYNYVIPDQDISSYYGIGYITDDNDRHFERSFIADDCLFKANPDNSAVLIKCFSPGSNAITVASKVRSNISGQTYRVTEIHDVAFAGIDCVTVNIDNGICKIGGDAFNNCQNLERVYIPESVLEIGAFAFQNCSNLKHVYYSGIMPPKIQDGAFPAQKRIIIHVPQGCVGEYRNILTIHVTKEYVGESAYRKIQKWNKHHYKIVD